MEPKVGFEPTTDGLRIRRELQRLGQCRTRAITSRLLSTPVEDRNDVRWRRGGEVNAVDVAHRTTELPRELVRRCPGGGERLDVVGLEQHDRERCPVGQLLVPYRVTGEAVAAVPVGELLAIRTAVAVEHLPVSCFLAGQDGQHES